MSPTERVLVIPPDGGRRYPLGAMEGVILADNAETGNAYCASTWWVEPRRMGVGAHSHEANEEVFFVIAGTMTLLVEDTWTSAPTGTFIRIPAGVTHGFRNDGDERAGVLNIFLPGGFEQRMPAIQQWFKDNPT